MFEDWEILEWCPSVYRSLNAQRQDTADLHTVVDVHFGAGQWIGDNLCTAGFAVIRCQNPPLAHAPNIPDACAFTSFDSFTAVRMLGPLCLCCCS